LLLPLFIIIIVIANFIQISSSWEFYRREAQLLQFISGHMSTYKNTATNMIDVYSLKYLHVLISQKYEISKYGDDIRYVKILDNNEW
jgi:hypothetical protein